MSEKTKSPFQKVLSFPQRPEVICLPVKWEMIAMCTEVWLPNTLMCRGRITFRAEAYFWSGRFGELSSLSSLGTDNWNRAGGCP